MSAPVEVPILRSVLQTVVQTSTLRASTQEVRSVRKQVRGPTCGYRLLVSDASSLHSETHIVHSLSMVVAFAAVSWLSGSEVAEVAVS